MMDTTTVFGVELKTVPTHVGNKLDDSRTENRIMLLQSKLDEKEEIISGCQKENLELERKLKEQTTDSQKLNLLHEKMVLDFRKQDGPVRCIDQVLSDENERLKEQIKQLQIDNSGKMAKIDQLQLRGMMATTTVFGVELKTAPMHVGNKLYDARTGNRIMLLQSKLDEKEEIISGCQKENFELERKLKEQTTDSQKLNLLHEKMVLDFKKQAGPVTCIDQVLSDENERLKEQIKQLQIDNSGKMAKIDQLQLSLSKVAGERLMEDNPFVTDLGDPNRPQKLAEKFNSLYDNSWTDAFEALSAKKKDKKSICVDLLKVLQECWTFCSELSNRQLASLHHTLHFADIPFERNMGESMKDIPAPNSKVFHDARKSCARQFIPHLSQHYWEKIASKDVVKEEILKPYVEACVELCWYSVITCPPIDYIFTAEKLDDFRGYTKNGEEVDYVVWPAMYLHTFGPLLYQGVVQFKQGSKNQE